MNRNIRPSWGAGCSDRVDIDFHGGSTSTNVTDGIGPISVEFGDEIGHCVANATGAGADKNLILALLSFRVKSNPAIEVNVGISVAASILNPDNHLFGIADGNLLGKADEIAAPVVVVRRKVDMVVTVPTQLPALWSIETHFRAVIAAVRVPLQEQLLMRSREMLKKVETHDLPSIRTDRRRRLCPRPRDVDSSCVL